MPVKDLLLIDIQDKYSSFLHYKQKFSSYYVLFYNNYHPLNLCAKNVGL